MASILFGLSLLLSCIIMRGDCLDFKTNERQLYTRLTREALIKFFSCAIPLKENYQTFLKLFNSNDFLFKPYHIEPIPSKELKFIEKNYRDIPMLYSAQIHRLQETDYGRRWLLANLNKLKNSDLGLDLMKPNLFTLDEQRIILDFALEYQRPFLWKEDFCALFPDLNVFDDERLWVYLDPFCFWSTSKYRFSQVIEILQRRVKKEANPAAILFLIIMEVPVDWDHIDIGHQELKILLQEYEKNFHDPLCWGMLWQSCELLISKFEDFYPPKSPFVAMLRILIIIETFLKGDNKWTFKQLEDFVTTHQPDELNFYLVIATSRLMSELNRRSNLEFKLPFTWKDTILKSCLVNIPPMDLHFSLRLKEWRKNIMELKSKGPSSNKRSSYTIYPNNIFSGMLAVDYYAKKVDELVKDGFLNLGSNIKFTCEASKSKIADVYYVWMTKIHQMAIYRQILPPLSDEFVKVIFMTKIDFEYCRLHFRELADAICLNPIDSSSPQVINDIIVATKTALVDFDIKFYYNTKNNAVIF